MLPDQDDPRRRRRLAVQIITAAVAANAAFVGLGSAFDYPDVLAEPAAQVLAAFRERSLTVSAWFLVLALGAAMLAPISLGIARLVEPNRAAAIRRLGIAAAAVQVLGLMRWPLVVPFLADQAADPAIAGRAEDAFDILGTVLGTVLGESFGYLLTAAWTVAVVIGLNGRVFGRVLAAAGLVSAALVAVGILVPFGVPGTDLANFIGYVLWSLWLVAVAVAIWRDTSVAVAQPR